MTSEKVNLKTSARFLAVAAMFVAVITGGKQALSLIPNVEIVSILTAVCGYVWGLGMALPVTIVFTLIQMAFYGFNMWVFEYLVYWPLLAICFWALGKVKFKKAVPETVCAVALIVVCTAFFGVFTSAVDTLIGFVGGKFKVVVTNYFSRFATMYVRGIAFYVAHVVSNAVFFAVGFHPLAVLNKKVKGRMFPEEVAAATECVDKKKSASPRRKKMCARKKIPPRAELQIVVPERIFVKAEKYNEHNIAIFVKCRKNEKILVECK